LKRIELPLSIRWWIHLLIIGTEEKIKKPRNSPKGLTVLKLFTVPELLNILRLKMRVLNPEGDNKKTPSCFSARGVLYANAVYY
jgi:hypothetical protein